MREVWLLVYLLSVVDFFPDKILMRLSELECYVQPVGFVFSALLDFRHAARSFLSDDSSILVGAPFLLRGLAEEPEVLRVVLVHST